jgi:DNA repair exonuclease SbcCD nuclease subunit
LHKPNAIEDINTPVLFTHVRGEIPPHVSPEVDLERFDKFKAVFAGDLHAHENTQRNIVYPGSPMTTSFHRNQVRTGALLIDDDWSWTWEQFHLPQLIRKTVTNPDDMTPTEFDHTIYELEGDVQDLAKVKNTDLLDKKVVKREVEATLNLTSEMSIADELSIYLKDILSLDDAKVSNILGVYNDYAAKANLG